jgi:hypothetical protein
MVDSHKLKNNQFLLGNQWPNYQISKRIFNTKWYYYNSILQFINAKVQSSNNVALIFTYWEHSIVPRLICFNCFFFMIIRLVICNWYVCFWANVLLISIFNQCQVNKMFSNNLQTYVGLYNSKKKRLDTINVNVDWSFIDIKGSNCWTIDKLKVSIEKKLSFVVNAMFSSSFVNPFWKKIQDVLFDYSNAWLLLWF